ncbi:MAG: hypothetical protein WCL60_16530 [Methylococcales bacterium]
MGIIIVASRYFFDIPVYRLPEDRYYRERDKYIEGMIYPEGSPFNEAMRTKEAADPHHNIAFRDHLQRTYGGCWRFNEIVGYIRLHFLGSQVRGEYYGVRKQRIVRSRTKTLEHQTWKLAPEIDIPYPHTNDGIFETARNYLEACRKELPGRYVDTELFEVVGKHVNWCDLFAEGERP